MAIEYSNFKERKEEEAGARKLYNENIQTLH
jgi:hypothetical protein